MEDNKRIFTVNGKPFNPLGAQADNQSGRSDTKPGTAFKAVAEVALIEEQSRECYIFGVGTR